MTMTDRTEARTMTGVIAEERYLTTREVAERLRVCPETVLRYYNEGLIPGRRLPGRHAAVRFVWREIDEAFAERQRDGR